MHKKGFGWLEGFGGNAKPIDETENGFVSAKPTDGDIGSSAKYFGRPIDYRPIDYRPID